MVQNKTLEGIKIFPAPKPNPDGSYTITLTTSQWKVFQDNQKKTPLEVPAEAPQVKEESVPKDKSVLKDEVEKPGRPDEKPKEKSVAKPEEGPKLEISVTQKPSRLSV